MMQWNRHAQNFHFLFIHSGFTRIPVHIGFPSSYSSILNLTHGLLCHATVMALFSYNMFVISSKDFPSLFE